jgi:hypothetical protein
MTAPWGRRESLVSIFSTSIVITDHCVISVTDVYILFCFLKLESLSLDMIRWLVT